MKSLARTSILFALMLFVGLFSTSASAYITCSGCRIFGGYTVSGESADSASGFGGYAPGSSAYSVSGSAASTGYRQQYDYCSRVYDPRACYQYYSPQDYRPDASGSDYYVLGGVVYK